MRAPAKIYMRKNSLLRKDAPACLPEKVANPNADSYAITGLQGITGITALAAQFREKRSSEVQPATVIKDLN